MFLVLFFRMKCIVLFSTCYHLLAAYTEHLVLAVFLYVNEALYMHEMLLEY